ARGLAVQHLLAAADVDVEAGPRDVREAQVGDGPGAELGPEALDQLGGQDPCGVGAQAGLVLRVVAVAQEPAGRARRREGTLEGRARAGRAREEAWDDAIAVASHGPGKLTLDRGAPPGEPRVRASRASLLTDEPRQVLDLLPVDRAAVPVGIHPAE